MHTHALRIARLTLIFGLIAAMWGAFAPAAAQPRPIRIGTVEPISTLDPADAGNFAVWDVLALLYTGLTRQRPGTSDYELALATDHTPSTDGLTHVFRLHPEAAFNDGTPITAQTFADSITRVLTVGGRASGLAREHIRAARALPDGALELELTRPVPYLWALLALPPFAPTHPEAFPPDRISSAPLKPISNGVYRVVATGARLQLEADPTWRGTPPAHPLIDILRYPRSAALREALKAGEIDLAWRGLPANDADAALKAVPTLREVRAPSLQAFYVLINQTSEPFNDPKARAVLLHLIDRERGAAIAHGEPLYGLIPAGVAGADGFRYPPFDLKTGEAALQAGGYSRYKVISSELQASRLLYGELYLAAVDSLTSPLTNVEAIRLGVFDTEPNTFLDQVDRAAFRLLVIGWTPLAAHPEAYLRPLLAGSVARGANYSNPDVVAALDRGDYAAAQALIGADVVLIPLWTASQMAYAAPTVQDIQIAPNFRLFYERLRLVE
jgi:ABC-type transport system substrate-binding protein